MAAQVAPAPPDAQPRGPARNVMAAPRGPPGPPRNIPVVDREKVSVVGFLVSPCAGVFLSLMCAGRGYRFKFALGSSFLLNNYDR